HQNGHFASPKATILATQCLPHLNNCAVTLGSRLQMLTTCQWRPLPLQMAAEYELHNTAAITKKQNKDP
ncbi:hypothetical protein QIG54_29360, partial [Klebsiella pneumoniae]|nr:hypothetical protein [Klebsiella pneumoniae]